MKTKYICFLLFISLFLLSCAKTDSSALPTDRPTITDTPAVNVNKIIIFNLDGEKKSFDNEAALIEYNKTASYGLAGKGSSFVMVGLCFQSDFWNSETAQSLQKAYYNGQFSQDQSKYKWFQDLLKEIGLYSSESASIDLSNNQVSSVFLYEDGSVGLRLYTKSYDISPFIELSHFSAVENIVIDYDTRPVAFD